MLAVVDDRCDPCLQILGITESADFLPVRQWGSEEFRKRPPEGLHARVCGMDAVMLYSHLNQDVGPSALDVVLGISDCSQLISIEGWSRRAPNHVCFSSPGWIFAD
jgi:hypothetical protein